MTARLVLGTAAFGSYAGQPGLIVSEAVALVEYALAHGIDTFDTSPDYGDSERVLGIALRQIGRRDARIATKVRCDGVGVFTVAQQVLASERRLGYLRLHLVQIHNATVADLRGRAAASLLSLREHGGPQVGASVYDLPAAVAAVRMGLNQVQVPYNLLDQRCRPVFAEARRAGCEVWARSPWLRGALAGPYRQHVPDHAVDAAVKALGRLQARDRQAAATVALRFALDGPAAVVAGPRTVQELRTAVQAWQAGRLPWWQRWLARTCASLDPQVVDPRTWDAAVNGLPPPPPSRPDRGTPCL